MGFLKSTKIESDKYFILALYWLWDLSYSVAPPRTPRATPKRRTVLPDDMTMDFTLSCPWSVFAYPAGISCTQKRPHEEPDTRRVRLQTSNTPMGFSFALCNTPFVRDKSSIRYVVCRKAFCIRLVLFLQHSCQEQDKHNLPSKKICLFTYTIRKIDLLSDLSFISPKKLESCWILSLLKSEIRIVSRRSFKLENGSSSL